MAILLVLLFITGVLSTSAEGPGLGKLWTATTTTQLGRVRKHIKNHNFVKYGVRHGDDNSTFEAASHCCRKCLAKYPTTTKFNYNFNLDFRGMPLTSSVNLLAVCYCLKDSPAKTAMAEPIYTVGTCGEKTFTDVIVGSSSRVDWIYGSHKYGRYPDENMVELGDLDGVAESSQCCEMCRNHIDKEDPRLPHTEIFTYIDADRERFPMFDKFPNGMCNCYGLSAKSKPRTMDSTMYSGVCEVCSGASQGIKCCSEGFTTGDNIGNAGEIFVQPDQYNYKEGCEATCQELYKKSTGISESLTQNYPGTDKKKCWCEFGEAEFKAHEGYQTCVFQ